jgi:HET-S-like prion-inhibition and propagation protein
MLLKVQRTRFLVWGQNFDIYKSGPNLEKLSPPVYETLIQTLIRIKELLEEVNEVGEKYGLSTPTPIESDIERNETIARQEIRRQATMVYKVDQSCSAFRKVRWTIYDRSKFETLVAQLTSLVDALYEFCPPDRQRDLSCNIEAEVLVTTLIDDGASGVRMLQEASQQIENKIIIGAQNFATVRASAETVDFSMTGQFAGGLSCFNPSRDIYLHHSAIRIANSPDHTKGRAWATFSTHTSHGIQYIPVVVEWCTYNEMTMQRVSKIDLQLKIEGLVRMLRDSTHRHRFRHLNCIGYFEDPTAARFGMVYRCPSDPTAGSVTAVSTLHQLLKSKHVPALEDRFALASLLAESLFSFLAAGWLHKTINSLNLLFFSSGNGPSSQQFSLKEPYLSGFARSRMVNNVILTSMGMAQFPDTLYCHPDVMGGERRTATNSHPLHDIYSLGTVLLEIGTWVRLEKRYIAGTDGPTFRRELTQDAVPQLGPAMGTRYMQIALKCIEGRFDGLANFNGTEPDYNLNLLRSFYWEVVSVLKSFQI